MSENNGKPTKSLMGLNVNLGQLTAALGPLGFVVWQGMAWATEIEANVKANQAQIAELIEVVEAGQESRDEATRKVLKLLEGLADDHDEPNGVELDAVD